MNRPEDIISLALYAALYFFDIFARPTLPTPDSLGFQLLPASPDLRPYVRGFWAFRRDAPLPSAQDAYLNPQGGFGLLFNFGDALRVDGPAVTDPVLLDGATTVARRVSFAGRVEQVGIQFAAGGAHAILGLPLIDLQNRVALLDALAPPPLLALHARLQEAPGLAARKDLLEAWLASRLAQSKLPDKLVPAALALQRQSQGRLPIPELSRTLAISQRQLERRYQLHVGMTPKQYGQLIRVEAARRALKQPGRAAAAALAVTLGYYDQAHFIREFQTVVGLTPAAYVKRSQA
jgi:AraC-like DNA-binding protein